MKDRFKRFNKVIVISLILTSILVPTILMTSTAYAANDDKAGFGEKMLSGITRGFGKGIENIFLNDPMNKIGAVVYNDGRNDLGLTLLKGTDLSIFFFEFYMIFQYIAGAIFVPMVIWVSIYFFRAGEDAQKKAELKDKLFRVFVTIILLTSMPSIIDAFLVVNGALVEIFRSILENKVLGVKGVDIKDGMLMKEFYDQAKDSGKLAESVVYLMSVFLNLFFTIYYFIRDITISYLFMLYPVLAVLTPLKKGIVVDWYVQMAANIFTQAAHALFLTIAIGIAYIPQQGNLLFALTGMALILPATGKLKSRLGLEGDIGAAKSMAGAGIMMGAYTLGRGVVGSLNKGIDPISEGYKEMRAVNAEMRLLKKKKSSDSKRGSTQSLETSNNTKKALDDLKGRKRLARKKMLQGFGRVTGGSASGVLTATGMSVFGGRTAALGFAGGVILGGSGGAIVGNSVGSAMNYAGANLEEMNEIQHKSIMEGTSYDEAEKEYYGLNDPLIQGSEYQKNELKARRANKIYTAMGKPDVAKAKYAKHTAKQYSEDELKNMDGVKMYQSDKMSALYRQNRDSSIDIFSTWEGNKDLEGRKPLSYDIEFDDRSLEINEDDYNDINGYAQERTLDIAASSNIPLYSKIYNEEFARIKSMKQQIQQLRANSGVSNLKLGKAVEFKKIGENFNLNTVKDLATIDEKNLIDISGKVHTFNQIPIEDGIGIINVSANGASVFKIDPDTNKMSLVGASTGDSSLVNGEMMQTGVKFKDGKVFADQIRYAIENSSSMSLENQPISDYNMSQVPKAMTVNAQADDIIEITVTEKNGQAFQNFVNTTSNQFMGRESMPYNIAQEKMNTTTRIVVNKQGDWQQVGNAQPMTTANMHNIMYSNSSIPYEAQRSYELGYQKNQIMTAINEMRAMYDIPMEFEKIGENFNLNTVKDLATVDGKNLIDISSKVHTFNQNPIEDGIGIINSSANGASVFKIDPGTNKMSLVGASTGDSSLVNGEMMQTGVKFKDGKVFADQIRYAIENSSSMSLENKPIADYNMSQVPKAMTANAQADDMIEITVTEENGQAFQNFVNTTSNQFMGRESMPYNIAQEKMNTTTRILVNKQGNWQQVGNAQPMTTANMHNIIHSNSSIPYEAQRSYELGYQKNQIMTAINEMRAMYDIPEANVQEEISNVL